MPPSILSEKELRAKWDTLATDGVLPKDNLSSLLLKCKLDSKARHVVQVQGGLRVLGGDIEDGIKFDIFSAWYKLHTQGGQYSSNNELLVRRVIEKCKLPTRNLREGSFVYGEKSTAEEFSAGEVVLNWAAGERSKSKEAGVSLIKVNKAACSAGAIKPKQVRDCCCCLFFWPALPHRRRPRFSLQFWSKRIEWHSSPHTFDSPLNSIPKLPPQVNEYLRKHRNDPKLQRPKIEGNKKKKNRIKRNEDVVYGLTSKRSEEEKIKDIVFPHRNSTITDGHYVDTSGQVRVNFFLPLSSSLSLSPRPLVGRAFHSLQICHESPSKLF